MNFQTFWAEYPKKVAKVDAEKAAKKIADSEWPAVLEGLRKYKKVWTDRQFIPYPGTFLNKRRWEDEIEDIAEVKRNQDCSNFINAIRLHKSFPGTELSRDILTTFQRMGIHYERLKQLSDDEIRTKFNQNYGESKPSNVVEFKRAAAGDTE